jgi:hypothetical protein
MLRAQSLFGLFASLCLGSAVVAGCSGPTETSFTDDPATGGSDPSGGSGGSSTGGASGTGGSGGSSGGSGGTTGTPPDGYLEPCESDKDCRAFSLLCDPAQGCVQCLEASTCPAPAQGEATCSAGLCGATVTCETSLECPPDQVCDTAAALCVECLTANDCADDEVCVANACAPQMKCEEPSDCTSGQVCDLTSGSCVECVSGADCASGSCMDHLCVTPPDCSVEEDCAATDQHCNVQTGECVECLSKEDCGGAENCSGFECVPAPLNCEGTPKVMLLLARSGGMFELPAPEANWWSAVRVALLEGDTPLVEEYDSRLDLGVRVFYRETTQDPSSETCPLAIEEQTGADPSDIANLLDDAQADHEAAVSQEIKIDAPLPETIASTAAALGTTGRRVIVLVTTGLPDTCSVIDSLCAMDPSVAAVQAARAEGIEVYVLGLGENDNVDWDYNVVPQVGYTGFLAALADAGSGSKVAGPPSIECETDSAEYSDSSGGTPYFHALDTASVAGELDALFTALVGACE